MKNQIVGWSFVAALFPFLFLVVSIVTFGWLALGIKIWTALALFILSIISIIFGFKGLSKCKEDSSLDGRRLAWFSIVVSILATIVLVVLTFVPRLLGY